MIIYFTCLKTQKSLIIGANIVIIQIVLDGYVLANSLNLDQTAPVTVQTLIRLLLEEQSDQDQNCLQILQFYDLPYSLYLAHSVITQTRPCNIQQYFKAVKMFIFR